MAKLFIVLTILLVAVSAAPKFGPNDQNSSWRIVGGKVADKGQFPYIVSLRLFGNHICGASILDSNWIITAGHCVNGFFPFMLNVVIGSTKLDSGGSSYKVEKSILHDEWNSKTLAHDIALVKLSSSIQFSNNVKPVSLNIQPVPGNEQATVCGWGSRSNSGSILNDLQFIDLNTISNEECQTRNSKTKIDDYHLCTFTREGEGMCLGDSGSPVVSAGELIALVSWGRACASGYPDVHTRISFYTNWIDRTIQTK